MPTEAKRAMVASLADGFTRSTTSIVTDYRGLSVADLAAIRRALRSQGVTYRVVKNRLAKIAATQAGADEIASLLEGPTALALGTGDASAVARVLLDAMRPYARIAKVRGALVGRRRIDGESVAILATLPPRDVLLGQLAGAVSAPLSSMAGLLAAPLRNLGYALTQLAEQKAAAGGA